MCDFGDQSAFTRKFRHANDVVKQHDQWKIHATTEAAHAGKFVHTCVIDAYLLLCSVNPWYNIQALELVT